MAKRVLRGTLIRQLGVTKGDIAGKGIAGEGNMRSVDGIAGNGVPENGIDAFDDDIFRRPQIAQQDKSASYRPGRGKFGSERYFGAKYITF